MHIAIQESDVFLIKLFALDGLRMAGPPRVTFNDEFASYDLHDLTVAIRPGEERGQG